MDIKIISSELAFSFREKGDFADPTLPEIIFLGRSNCGKSTLINRLLQRRNLARASKKPGMTRSVNYYKTKVLFQGIKKDFFLVDFPGFGYAKFSKKDRERFAKLIVDYLRTRQSLKVVAMLLDSRRVAGEDELAIKDISFSRGTLFLPIITKADKLKKNELKKSVREIAKSYHLDEDKIIITGEGISINPLLTAICRSI